jgi:hypothetical protein
VGYQSAVTRSSASGPAAANRRLNRQQRPARFGQGVDATGIVPDAIVDVVGVLLLVAAVDCEALHGQERRNRGDGDFDPVATCANYRPVGADSEGGAEAETGRQLARLQGAIVGNFSDGVGKPILALRPL